MAKKWSDVAASAAFQSLSLEEQEEARNQYFEGIIAPQVDAADLSAVRDQFFADTALKPKAAPVVETPKADDRGIIQRVKDFISPEYKSVMEGYKPTPQEKQANVDRRLSYGAGPISSQTEAKADLVRSGIEKSDDATVKKVAAEMDRRKQQSFGDLVQRAKDADPTRFEEQAQSDQRKQFAEDNPVLGSVASGAAGMLSGAINIPNVAADAFNQTFVNPVLQAAGFNPIPRVANAIGTKYLATAASDFMPKVGKQEMGTALDRGEFTPWLVSKLAANSPQIAQSLVAAFVPPLRAAILPALSGTAAGQSFAEGDDSRVAVAKGAVEFATEKLPLGVFDKVTDVLKGMSPAKSNAILAIAGQRMLQAGGAVTVNGLTNAIEETAAQFGGNVLDKYFQGKDIELSKGLGEAAVVGAAAGKAMTVPQVAGIATGAYDPNVQVARALQQGVDQTDFASADPIARGLLDPNSYDPSIVSPTQTSKIVNFTPAGSPTQQAGLVDIEVPVPNAAPVLPPVDQSTEEEFGLDKLRMGGGNVGTGGTTQTEARGGGVAGGDQLGGGVDVSGSAVAGAAGQLGGSAGLPAPDAAQALATGNAGGQQSATLTQENNNAVAGALVEPWFGRKGGGYTTIGDAEQALPGRRRKFPDLQWRVEQMPNGRYMLGGYEAQQQETTNGAQATQAQQAESQIAGATNQGMAAGSQSLATGPAGAGVSGAPSVGAGQEGQLRGVGDFGQLQTGGSSVAVPAQGDAGQGDTAPIVLTKEASAPVAAIRLAIDSVKRNDGVEIATVPAKELDEQQKATMLLATMHGNTVTYYETVAGDPNKSPNGLVVNRKHILIDAKAADAPVAVAMHEVSHALPEHIRLPLHKALRQLFKTGKEAEFASEFSYSADQLDEEIPAMITQAVMHNKEFWSDLRDAMGDGDFVELANIIIARLDFWIKNVRGTYGDAFADKYVSDVAEARRLLVEAHAQAMKEQSTENSGQEVQSSNRADAVYTHEVVDPRDNNRVMGRYQSANAARRGADRLDNQYGAYRYQVRKIETGSIADKLQQRIDSDFDGAVAEYNQLKGSKGGRVLDADIARELSPEYRADRSRAFEIHEVVSDFMQRVYEDRMAVPGTGDIVAFMAGGGGAGKSSAEELLSPVLDRASTVVDGTLSSYDKAERNIQLALDSGRQVRIAYVYRDPVDALVNGVLKRARDSGGRTVPLDALVKGHAGSSTVVRKLQAKFGDNPMFKIFAVDNSRGKNNAVLANLEDLTPVIIEGLKERFINATQQQLQQGSIDDKLYRSTIGGQADAATEAQGQIGGRQVRQGNDGSPQQGDQSVGSQNQIVQSRRARGEQVGDYRVATSKDGSVTVYGDAEAIRALMPDGVTGRVTNDGVVFTNAAAPRVRAALEGRRIAYSRGGAVLDKLPMKDGKYLGAPEKFNTPGKIPTLRKWLRQLAEEGAPGRYWYENSGKEVLKMVGGDVQEARKFVALLAIYSPQAKVDANSTFALRAWAQYKAGQPISVKTGVMDSKAKNALEHVDEFWSGEKTGNFFFNLLREIDPSTEGKQGATIDMWMMRAGQYSNDAPTATQYAFMENETNRLAAELGWEPQQVQAAIWVAMKARMENAGVKKATEASSEKKGWLRYDYPLKNGKPFKTRVILDAQKHRDNWLKHSFEHDPTKDDTQQAKFDFGDGLKRHIGQVSFEARPGRSTGVLPGIHNAPYAQQVEFQQAVQSAFLDEDGNDRLAQLLGLLVDTTDVLAPGVWQGDVSPSSQKLIAMAPAKGDAGKSNVDPAQAEALNIYAAVAGLVARQEGVGWHRPFYAGTKRDSNGLDINLGRVINPAEAKDLEAAVAKWMADNGKDGWQDQFALISSPTGIRLVNFGIITNDILQSEIVKVAEGVLPDFDYRVFASDGDMPTNNWKENPNGESYVQRISAAGRSDILDWARAVLAPRVQSVFDDFSKRYDWGDAGSVQFSNRVARPAEPAGRPGAGRNQGDGVSIEQAVHFGRQAGLSVLSGTSFGSGIKGAEQARLSAPDVDPRIKRRVYFYLPTEGGIPQPEIGLGANVYTANLSNLYDPSAGVRRFPSDPNAFESAVLDAGFRGYINREQGTAVVLNSDVPVKSQGTTAGKAIVPRKATVTAPKVQTREEGDELVRKPTSEEMIGIIKARPELAKVAPSFKLEFGEARVKADEVEAADQALEDAGASFRFGEVMASNRAANLADDLAEQDKFLQQKAEEAGYKNIDEFVDQDYAGFVEAAAQWRRDNPVEMMMAKRGKKSAATKLKSAARTAKSLVAGRDELGNVQFGAGNVAYRLIADLTNVVLDKMALKPISTDLSRAMRQMKVEISKARELTVNVAGKLGKLSQQERELISDVIEGELKAGAKPPKRILQIAASMQSIMSEQTEELVRLGMLSEDAAGRWDGKYLPRFYESKLKTEAKGWAKAAKALLGRQKTMQGIGGSSLKGRGKFQTIPVGELEQWLAEGWEQRDPNFDPATDTEITVWRDYTRTERDDMGEIRDAMFRFVMGYNKSQRDISLGRLYENIANTVASKKEKEGYVQVPRTNVEDTYAKRYGKLSGMWVPQEVLDHLSAFDDSQRSELMKMYLKGMSLWKEGKTVLNPVSHANNVMSNITMAHFAGVSYWDIGKYIAATRDLMQNSAMVKEAKDAGLWTGTMTQAELVQLLPDQLKVLAAKTESTPSKVGGAVWDAMSFWLRKPLGKAYEAEDLYFRYLIYRDARKNGLKPADAVDYAQKYIFTYDDLPKGARKIRDFALPFFAYTYKVVPTLAETALKYPWRYAAPATALYTVNAMMYAFAASLGGGEDEDWWTVIQRYVTDPEFRAKAQAMEADERKNLPPWVKGASMTLGTSKAVRLGVDELTGLPVFLDVSRIFPGGDLFDAQNNAGGIPLLSPITPNSPILTTAYAMLANKDTFRGTEVVKPSDTDAEAARKRAGWVWSQFTPAIAVGNGHFDRAMNVIANQVGQPLNLGFAEYTGTDKQGMPAQGKYAAMQTVGIKARPIDLETSEAIQKAEVQKMIREVDAEIKKIKRLESKGAISFENAERQREYQKEKRQRLKEGLTVDGDERE